MIIFFGLGLLLVSAILIVPLLLVMAVFFKGSETTGYAQKEAAKVSQAKQGVSPVLSTVPMGQKTADEPQKPTVTVQDGVAVKEKYFEFYLSKYISKHYPKISHWVYGNTSTMVHHTKPFVLVRLIYPTGLSECVQVSSREVFRFAMEAEHIFVPDTEEPPEGEETTEEEVVELSDAQKWVMDNATELSLKKTKAEASGQTAYTVEIPEHLKDSAVEIAEILMKQTGYNITVDDHNAKLIIEFDL